MAERHKARDWPPDVVNVAGTTLLMANVALQQWRREDFGEALVTARVAKGGLLLLGKILDELQGRSDLVPPHGKAALGQGWTVQPSPPTTAAPPVSPGTDASGGDAAPAGRQPPCLAGRPGA